jgi:hypothetical protein
MKEYLVRPAPMAAGVAAEWDDPLWSGVTALEVAEFRPESSGHRPRTRARLLHTDDGLHGIFHVEDRYVACRHTRYQAQVCEDSCVEVFLQPKAGDGYLNFEMNCGGTLHAAYVTDHRRDNGALAAAVPLTEGEGRQVAIRTSLPRVVDPEIASEVDWELAFFIPRSVLEGHVGPIGPLAGQEWRANLYKCADRTSHPHWAAWSPVDALNFHLPSCFGRLRFAG